MLLEVEVLQEVAASHELVVHFGISALGLRTLLGGYNLLRFFVVGSCYVSSDQLLVFRDHLAVLTGRLGLTSLKVILDCEGLSDLVFLRLPVEKGFAGLAEEELDAGALHAVDRDGYSLAC